MSGRASLVPTGGRIESVSAIVTRADGTREDHGVVARQFRHPSRLKQWWGNVLIRAGLA